jgi:hypothetical protein
MEFNIFKKRSREYLHKPWARVLPLCVTDGDDGDHEAAGLGGSH